LTHSVVVVLVAAAASSAAAVVVVVVVALVWVKAEPLYPHHNQIVRWDNFLSSCCRCHFVGNWICRP